MANRQQQFTRPSIFKIGTVGSIGFVVQVSGWGVGLCMYGCVCHKDPTTGQLDMLNAPQPGQHNLGLAKNFDCNCCQPWTPLELASMLRTLDEITSQPEVTKEQTS